MMMKHKAFMEELQGLITQAYQLMSKNKGDSEEAGEELMEGLSEAGDTPAPSEEESSLSDLANEPEPSESDPFEDSKKDFFKNSGKIKPKPGALMMMSVTEKKKPSFPPAKKGKGLKYG